MNLLQFNLTTVRENVLHQHFHRLIGGEKCRGATTEGRKLLIDMRNTVRSVKLIVCVTKTTNPPSTEYKKKEKKMGRI